MKACETCAYLKFGDRCSYSPPPILAELYDGLYAEPGTNIVWGHSYDKELPTVDRAFCCDAYKRKGWWRWR